MIIQNSKLIDQRSRKAKKVGNFLAKFPFVRCVTLNGSLAQGKSEESSDIDIMIIAKSGRIFTARFFVNGITTLLRLKRSPDESKNHAGKFCFNHFLTENYLRIPTGRGEKMDRYCAENFSQSVFIAGNRNLFNKFLQANEKLFEKYSCHPKNTFILSSRAKCNPFDRLRAGSVERSCEKLTTKDSSTSLGMTSKKSGMTHGFGDWFEQVVKNYQIKKIESDPRTKKYPTLIAYNDLEMRFHPPKQS